MTGTTPNHRDLSEDLKPVAFSFGTQPYELMSGKVCSLRYTAAYGHRPRPGGFLRLKLFLIYFRGSASMFRLLPRLIFMEWLSRFRR